MSIQPKHAFADLLSVGLGAALVFGSGALQEFAYYVLLVIVSLGWIAVICVGVKGETAQSIRDRVWWSGFLSALQLLALIVSGHPVLAAFSLVLSMLIVGAAFKEQAA
ncbi:MAG: hypothetical protein CML01_11485 [Pseudomonas sp.]|nr:hypothetical protein [Pseudomonas sp.]|tara:strand:- start:49234 stop:49557 length:324 start_codon:yes stop_codon:yes gene_type:complete